MKQPKYKAVVYDVDGTAVDSRYNIDALPGNLHRIARSGSYRRGTENHLRHDC